MKTTIIIPSIRVPQSLAEWAVMLNSGDEVIIAGNERSPHDDIETNLAQLAYEFETVSFEYLRPDDKWVTSQPINDCLEPNHTHRRNLALLMALEHGTDLLVTIDDDNFPHKVTWLDGVKNLVTEPNRVRPVVVSPDGWWNPGELCVPKVIHRGYPASLWARQQDNSGRLSHDEKIGVHAALWLGDPDINAAERLLIDPVVTNVVHSALADVDTWAPFDSQSTAVIGSLAPFMFMWTGVGRYDDIWASYLMRRVMDERRLFVSYGHPLVRQERNPHDFVIDLQAEVFGYKNTEKLCDVLRTVDIDVAWTASETMNTITEAIVTQCSWMPMNTLIGLRTWAKQLEKLGL